MTQKVCVFKLTNNLFVDVWQKKINLDLAWAADIYSLGMLVKFLVTGDCSDSTVECLHETSSEFLFDFARRCLVDAEYRLSAQELLKHRFISRGTSTVSVEGDF